METILNPIHQQNRHTSNFTFLDFSSYQDIGDFFLSESQKKKLNAEENDENSNSDDEEEDNTQTTDSKQKKS